MKGTKAKLRHNAPVCSKSFDIDRKLDAAFKAHQHGQLDKAKKIFKKILRIEPYCADAIHFLGLVHGQLGNNVVAEKLLAKAIKINPGNPIYYNNMGTFFKDQNDLAQAVACYRKAVCLNPDYAEAYLNLGLALAKQDRQAEAVACYRKSVGLEPRNAQAFFFMGNALSHEGLLDEAVASYRDAVHIRPDFVEAHINMANCLLDQGRYEEAIKSYRTAVTLQPERAEFYNNMGNAFLRQNKLDQAVSCYQRAVQLRPGCAEFHSNMGFALEKQDKLDEAIAAFKRAAHLDRENPSIEHHIAALTGRTTQAAPIQYVRDVFDQNAKRFESDLVERLEYTTPVLLYELLDSILEKGIRFQNVVDLGCGTGLSGVAFRGISDRLIGIDISPRMLEEAKDKLIYDDMHRLDIVEFLTHTHEKFDLCIAADVFVYYGDLQPMFAAVHSCLASGSYFVFSTESSQSKEFILRKTRRYAHSVSYIASLAEKYGFSVEAHSKKGIRKEKGRWIIGSLFALQRV